MPNFNATLNSYLAASTALDNMRTGIDGTYYLGLNGYYVFIRLDLLSEQRVQVRLKGPEEDINKLPEVVFNNYAIVKQEVNDWINGNANNFPDFEGRF